MNEADYQAQIIRKVEKLLPGCVILKNDSSYRPGIPDILILFGNLWAMLEVKPYKTARYRPNQDFYINKLDDMGFASVIYPEIEEAILHDLQQSFGFTG